MLQMRMMMNRQAAPVMMQPQNQPVFEGLGLMAELDNATLPSESPSLGTFSV